MLLRLILPQPLVQLVQPKRFYILPQLEVAVSQKQPKVHTKVMNVPTVVHVMVKVVYAHVTKVIQANHAKHKQFWFKFAKKTSLNSKQKEMYFHIYNNKVDFKM
jgi:hypothetical protein